MTKESVSQKTAVIEAIDNYCKSHLGYSESLAKTFNRTDLKHADWHVVGQENYGKEGLFRQKGNAIDFSATCYNDKLSREENGSGREFILVKRPTGAWLVISAEQMVPDCEMLDGYGIPRGFRVCRDGDGDGSVIRDPR